MEIPTRNDWWRLNRAHELLTGELSANDDANAPSRYAKGDRHDHRERFEDVFHPKVAPSLGLDKSLTCFYENISYSVSIAEIDIRMK